MDIQPDLDHWRRLDGFPQAVVLVGRHDHEQKSSISGAAELAAQPRWNCCAATQRRRASASGGRLR